MRESVHPWGTMDRGESSPGLGYYWHRFWELGGDYRRWILPMILRGLLRKYQFDSPHIVALGKGVIIIRRGGQLVTGSGVRIADHCFMDVGASGVLSIGTRTIIGPYTRIMAATQVRIGARCMISWNCSIFDSIGHRLWLEETGEVEVEEPITIGDDVWIGPYSIIMKGVTIGSNSVIGAGSVVRRDVPPDSLVYGNPARVAGKVVRWER
jgi:acetyltransferase-like isoleucine patch superfamily enzyme